MTKLIAGNWKMNGLRASLAEIDATIEGLGNLGDVEMLICPPFTLLAAAAERAEGSRLAIGGQDCHGAEAGAHTGDVSARMLADAGASHVILGHSERRADHGETDDTVRAKLRAAWDAGLTAIVCVGEVLADRDAGRARFVVAEQLDASLPDRLAEGRLVIAYEPVWAIGTGRVAEPSDVAEMHGSIRQQLAQRYGDAASTGFPILYGGSVKPGNAGELFAVDDVDGALVGGASLEAKSLLAIAAAAG